MVEKEFVLGSKGASEIPVYPQLRLPSPHRPSCKTLEDPSPLGLGTFVTPGSRYPRRASFNSFILKRSGYLLGEIREVSCHYYLHSRS